MARYADIETSATLAEMIPTIIAPEVTNSAARLEVFRPLAREFEMVGPGGAKQIVTTLGLTFATQATEGTAPDEQDFNTGSRTLDPGPMLADVIVGLKPWVESAVDVADTIVKEGAIALAKSHDALFAALYTEAPSTTPTHDYGTDALALSFTSLTACMDLMYIQSAPRPFNWVVYPTQWASELLKDNTLIDASVKGSPVLTAGIADNGFVTQVLDVRIFVSDQILESSGRHSIMFADKAAFGYCYRRISSPMTNNPQELMVDLDWQSGKRAVEVNMTYYAAAGGLKGTSATTNNWVIDIIS